MLSLANNAQCAHLIPGFFYHGKGQVRFSTSCVPSTPKKVKVMSVFGYSIDSQVIALCSTFLISQHDLQISLMLH